MVYNPSAPLGPTYLKDAYENTATDTDYAPLIPQAIGKPDVTIPLNVFFDTMDDGTNHAMFENITYNRPNVPSLLTALSMGANAEDVAVYGPMSNVLEYNQIVELDVFNWDAGNHPL